MAAASMSGSGSVESVDTKSDEAMDVDMGKQGKGKEKGSKEQAEHEGDSLGLEQKAVELKQKGNKKYSSHDYYDAIDFYSQAIATYQKPEFFGNRAAAYLTINQFGKALEDCQSALKLDSTFRKAYIRGVKCLTELGRLTEAKQMAQDGLRLYANDKELKDQRNNVNYVTRQLDLLNGKINEVSQKYNSLYEHLLTSNDNNQNSNMNNNLNGNNINNNNNNNNNNDNNNGNNDNNTSENANDNIDEKSQDLNLDEKSNLLSEQDKATMAYYLKLIDKLQADHMSKSLELGCLKVKALIVKQDYDMALSQATILLRTDSNFVASIRIRAIALFKNQNTDSAIKHMKSVLTKDPDNRGARELFKLFKATMRYKEAGNDAFKARDFDKAIENYTLCLRQDPTNHSLNSVVFCNRAAVWLAKENYENAYQDCCYSLEMNDSYVKAYVRRQKALFGLERYDEAEGDADRAYKLDPQNPELRNNLQQLKRECKKAKRKNYYKILGVPNNATDEEIRKGFKKSAMKWHPDRCGGSDEKEKAKAEAKFKEIGEAYEVLKDPKMKAKYDQGYDLDEIKNGSSSFSHGGVDISSIFDLLGGMHGGGAGAHARAGHPGMGQRGFTFQFG